MPAKPPFARLDQYNVEDSVFRRGNLVQLQTGFPLRFRCSFEKQLGDFLRQRTDSRLKVVVSRQVPVPFPDVNVSKFGERFRRVPFGEHAPDASSQLVAIRAGDLVDRESPGPRENRFEIELAVAPNVIGNLERDESGS